jgi:hypothetical protein
MFGRNSLEEKMCGGDYAAIEQMAHSIEMRPYELLLLVFYGRLRRAKVQLEPHWGLNEARTVVQEWQPKTNAGGAR